MAEATERQNMSAHIAIDVLDSIRERLSITRSLTSNEQETNEQPTIYRVPMSIRQYKNEAYEPRLISIGPYHRNKQSLLPMEEHKWRYLNAILFRNREEVSLEVLLAKIEKLEPQARRFYSERIELDRNEFLEMMLVDGCFIVELITGAPEDPRDDLICADMLLLENQLPYCILQCIYRYVSRRPNADADGQLRDDVISFCSINLSPPLRLYRSQEVSFHHLLHLIHCHCCLGTSTPEQPSSITSLAFEKDRTSKHRSIPSAEKLKDSGIKFKRKKDEDSVLPVEFKKENGVVEIRSLFIDALVIGLLRNFLAFEQCYRSAGSYFTIYTAFMDSVINSKADVEILCKKGILRHFCGSDEELVLLFSELTKSNPVGIRDHHLSSLFNSVNDYCEGKRKSRRHRWKASLMRDYVGSPWSIIALIGAIVVVILTAIQSFFSVYAYVRPPH